jgi:hypothetical protein
LESERAVGSAQRAEKKNTWLSRCLFCALQELRVMQGIPRIVP